MDRLPNVKTTGGTRKTAKSGTLSNSQLIAYRRIVEYRKTKILTNDEVERRKPETNQNLSQPVRSKSYKTKVSPEFTIVSVQPPSVDVIQKPTLENKGNKLGLPSAPRLDSIDSAGIVGSYSSYLKRYEIKNQEKLSPLRQTASSKLERKLQKEIEHISHKVNKTTLKTFVDDTFEDLSPERVEITVKNISLPNVELEDYRHGSNIESYNVQSEKNSVPTGVIADNVIFNVFGSIFGLL